NDLKPMLVEVKRLPKKTMRVAQLEKGKPMMTAKTSLKLHLLQVMMGAMEMRLTRRARKTARRQEKTEKLTEKYQKLVQRMRREFARLNPKMTEKLQAQAKARLTAEMTELEKMAGNRAQRRKKKASAQGNRTQR